MLYQGRDNSTVISLIMNINSIRSTFGRDPLPGGGLVQEIQVNSLGSTIMLFNYFVLCIDIYFGGGGG